MFSNVGNILSAAHNDSSKRMMRSWMLTAAVALLFPAPSPAFQEEQLQSSYTTPPAPITDYLNRDKNLATLDRISPDGDYFLIPSTTELSTAELMSQKIYRLAMLKITPATNRELDHSTYGIYALKIFSLKDKTSRQVKLPPDSFFSDMVWSPDGKKIAFLAHLPKGTQVWIADAETGTAEAVSDAPVMATIAARPQSGRSSATPSRMLQWTSDGSLLTLLVPSNRGPEPVLNPVPAGPIVRHSLDKPTPTRTLPFLLRTPHDADLFRYYTTAQPAILARGRAPLKIGAPAMYLSLSVSADGKYILTDRIIEPFSYLVGYDAFPHQYEIMDLAGNVLTTVSKAPAELALRRDGDAAGADLPRDLAWRPDGKGLSYIMTEPRDNKAGGAQDAPERQERIMLLEPPFAMDRAKVLVSSARRISEVSYSQDCRYALATLSDRPRAGGKRLQDIVAYDLTAEPHQSFVLAKNIDPEDLVNLPGTMISRTTGNGIRYTAISADGQACFLEGPGHKADFKPRPFIDRVAIRTAEKQRVFEGSADMYERPLAALDYDLTRLIVRRESSRKIPDSYLWTKEGFGENLTNNKDPYPDLTECRKIDFSFQRSDGVTVHGRISLPVNYREGTRVPAVFWDYPREYGTSEEYTRAAITARNNNAHTPLSFLRWSDLWLTQGYALVYTDIPILGKATAYNDNYLAHLLDSVYGAIRKLDQMGLIDVDRLGHGGHSYGAFATANLLAHSPFFKAGIAGDGAYNRTLTPMTFQQEKRFFWEATTTYLEMSPFFYADQINAPLLMYHGADDDNSGTYLIQSERMMQALTGLGKKAVLYIYPFEAHSPRCRETYLDIWARWIDWFDRYVKNPAPAKGKPSAP